MNAACILVVEDNTDNLNLVRFILEQANFVVLEAQNGHRALEVARESLPDMILLDMGIPGLDGWTVARTLRGDPLTSGICVVALTAHILPGERKKALEAGCDGFIAKPLDMPTFVSQVNEYLEEHRKTA